VLYPAFGDDHSALPLLLADLADPQFPPAADLPRRAVPPKVTQNEEAKPDERSIPVHWIPEPEPIEHFTGRVEELARLDRWAADPQVSLAG
jgi:hypothetical protein